jgi:DNA-binding transcriptional ArsR family regulator
MVSSQDTRAMGDTDLAAIGALLAEPARAKILMALGDGRALPASVLAAEAGVAPSTASSHLARLLEGGLLEVLPQGRHRYYRLAGPEIGELIETLARMAPTMPVRSLREDTRAHAIRAGRTCYDHLDGTPRGGRVRCADRSRLGAGGDGVHHLERARQDRLSSRGRDLNYRLTTAGHAKLSRLGVALAEPDPDGTLPLRYCVDWTEQRHHLSGAVGRSLASRLLELQWISRSPKGRAVKVTDLGQSRLQTELEVSL